jgi:hypothetical protein
MKQIISILLSHLLLLSSSGVAYAQHFCGDYEMMGKITLGQEQMSCGMVMADTVCEDEQAEDHHCCDNEYTQVDTDDHFATTDFNIQFAVAFVASLDVAYQIDLVNNYNLQVDNFKFYDPPPLLRDVQVLYDTFLI